MKINIVPLFDLDPSIMSYPNRDTCQEWLMYFLKKKFCFNSNHSALGVFRYFIALLLYSIHSV